MCKEENSSSACRRYADPPRHWQLSDLPTRLDTCEQSNGADLKIHSSDIAIGAEINNGSEGIRGQFPVLTQ